MDNIRVNGTLVWYYFICKREVWLMSHSLQPDQEEQNIEIGRFIHENSYSRNKKEISIGNIKVDILSKKDGYVLLGEMKKSSKHKKSAKMQLAYYLLELKRKGIEGQGSLMFPKEKKRIEVILNNELEEEIKGVEEDIRKIILEEKPPKQIKISLCKTCAYSEFCWA